MKWHVTDLQLRFVPDPVLRAVCAPVTVFDAELAALAKDMLDVMYAALLELVQLIHEQLPSLMFWRAKRSD